MNSLSLKEIKHISQFGLINGYQIPKLKENFNLIIQNQDLHLLHKIITGDHVTLALKILEETGFLEYLIPEIRDNKNIESTKHYKKIWPHTLQVINQTPKILPIRWAALFHDLGKYKTFEIINNKVTFHFHERESAHIFNSFTRRIDIFSYNQKRCIYSLIKNLEYIENYNSSWSDSAVRRFIKKISPYTNELIILSKADITTKNKDKKQKILERVRNLENRIIQIKQKDKTYFPKGLGNAISTNLNIELGPEIGEIKDFLKSQIDIGKILPNKDVEYYIEEVRKWENYD